MESLIQQYGYAAILLGTFFEGEITLILGAVAAQAGLLDLPLVISAAVTGTLASDQLFFFLGRTRGHKMLPRHPHWQSPVAHVQRILQRYQIAVVFGFRFLYGLRTVTPFVLGMSRVSPTLFMGFNLAGTLVWASSVALLGYYFGLVVQKAIGEIQRFQIGALVVLVIGALAVLSVFLYKRRGE